MKKVLAIMLMMMGFALSSNADVITTCEVYGEPGATATLTSKGGKVGADGKIFAGVKVSGCEAKDKDRNIKVWVEVINMDDPGKVLTRSSISVQIKAKSTSGSWNTQITGLPKGAYVVFSISNALTCK